MFTNEERSYKLCSDFRAESCKYLHKSTVYERNATQMNVLRIRTQAVDINLKKMKICVIEVAF